MLPSSSSDAGTGRTACRMEVLGRVSSLAFSADSNACLLATVISGAHIFNMDESFYGPHLFAGMSASSVESYSARSIGEEPQLSSCFLGAGRLIALGSSRGVITVISRQSRSLTARYKVVSESGFDDSASGTDLPIRSLHEVPLEPGAVLACTEHGAELVDVERCICLNTVRTPVPRAVAAVPLATPYNYAVANYDGKVLLYDIRTGSSPTTILSIPDQITTLSVCQHTTKVCAGTVAGRAFTLRCIDGAFREQAFGTGRKRAPITSLSIWRTKIAAGDLGGRLSIIDTADIPNPTKYWTPETLQLPDRADSSGGVAWEGTEVTAALLTQGIAWVTFSSPDAMQSQVVALPA